MIRKRMKASKDRKIFSHTANRTRVENLPGRILFRGGRRR